MSVCRRGSGRGDGTPQAAAPAEGGGDTEQGQGAGHGGGWANLQPDRVNDICFGLVLEVGTESPGADQTRGGVGEAQSGEGGVVEGSAADNRIAGAVRSVDAENAKGVTGNCKGGNYPTDTGGSNDNSGRYTRELLRANNWIDWKLARSRSCNKVTKSSKMPCRLFVPRVKRSL